MTQESSEKEIDGQTVLNWMKEVGLAKARDLMIGLYVDNGIDIHLFEIVDIDSSWAVLGKFCGKTRRIPSGLLRSSIVIEKRRGWPLFESINSLKTDGERRIDAAKQELRALGFPVAKLVNASDAFVALAMMKDFQSARLPTPEQQADRYDVIRRSSLHSLGAKIIRQWHVSSLKLTSTMDGSVVIKLVYCLRHSGQLDQALETVDDALNRNARISLFQMQKAILATERAAVLLDLYEIRREPELLVEARRSAGMSFAISQSDEVRAVYQRLRKLED